jgi:hypothetical protein
VTSPPSADSPSEMNEQWYEELEQLIQTACAALKGSVKHRILIDAIVRKLQAQRIPRSKNESRLQRLPLHQLRQELRQDALSTTWIHFLANLCEATTKNTESSYCSQTGEHVVARLCDYFGHRVFDLVTAWGIEQQNRDQRTDRDGNLRDINNLPSPVKKPDLLDDLIKQVEEDTDDKLKSVCLKNKPEITAQVLLRQMLQTAKETNKFKFGDVIQSIANEHNIKPARLSRFYYDHCKPLITQLGNTRSNSANPGGNPE